MNHHPDALAVLLLLHGLISPEQLVCAVKIRDNASVPLEDLLLKLGHTTPALVKRMRLLLGRPLDLTEIHIHWAVLEVMPSSIARENVVLPLAWVGRTLFLAVDSPSSDVRDKLRFVLNTDVAFLPMPRQRILENINRHYDDSTNSLVRKRILSSDQLAEAKGVAQSTGANLNDVLVKLGYATQEQVMSAIAEHSGMQFVDLSEASIPPAVVELVPESVARDCVVLPWAQDGQVLKIVMHDPSDAATLDKLQFILNRQITPLLAPKEQIVEAINRHYGQSETESVDSMLMGFTDTAIDFTETESTSRRWDSVPVPVQRTRTESQAATPPMVSRRATVRYYHRLAPERMFPLLVILSGQSIQQVQQRGVAQRESERFQVAKGSLVEIEPVLPGCTCYPPRDTVRVESGETTALFYVVPHVLGKIQEARVVVRQEGTILTQVPLDMRSARQTMALLMGGLSLILPFVLLLLKYFRLDFETQAQEDFGLYAQIAGWLVQALTPESLTVLLLLVTATLYLWFRPRRRDAFRDVVPNGNANEPEVEPTTNSAPGVASLEQADRYFQAGEHAIALEYYIQNLTRWKSNSNVYFRASLCAYHLGRIDQALYLLQLAEWRLPARKMKASLWYNMGCFAARLGRPNDALRYLGRAADNGFTDPAKYRNDPDLEPLRWHHGFKRFLAGLRG